MYLQLPCPSWHQWRVHAWVFVTMNFSHVVILLTCYVHHLSARQLRLNGGSSKCKQSASCPTERSRESWRKQLFHSFSRDFIFFFLNPSQWESGRMEIFILSHLFTCPTNMSFWKILYIDESETFLKENKMSSSLKTMHLSSPLSSSCLSGLQRKHCHTILVSFQVNRNLVWSIIWGNKENLPLDSRLGWIVGISPITDESHSSEWKGIARSKPRTGCLCW